MNLLKKVPEVVVTIVLIALALTVVLPMLIPMFFVFKTRLEFAYDPWGWPTTIRWDNFIGAWNAIRIDQGLINTLYVSLGAILCTVPPAAMAGYIFARYRSRVTEIIFYLVLAGYFVPALMVLIPLYRLSARMGLANTLPGLFLPMAAFGIPFWTIIYRSFFRAFRQLAARRRRRHLDLFRVMLPRGRPPPPRGLLVFIGAWALPL